MPKRAGIVLVITGAVLMLSALLLFVYNRQEAHYAGEQADAALRQLQDMLAQDLQDGTGELPASGAVHGQGTHGPLWDTPLAETLPPGLDRREREEATEEGDADMRVVTVSGYDYIGYLTIPAIDLCLPILSDWDVVRLKLAPCRQAGSVYADDLIIAGHNYDTFFARLGEMRPLDEVMVTDMDGQDHRFQVIRVETLLPDAVEEVLASGHDLVLYTCTVSAEERIVVFCDRAEE